MSPGSVTRAAGGTPGPPTGARLLRGPEEAEVLRASLALGPVELRAGGVSMRPRLRAGDTVRLERRAARRGDIVLAVCEGRLVLHRVVRRRGDAWLLHGDARPRPDGWIRDADVLGVATARRARPGERRGSRHRLDGALHRWLGIATVALLAPLRTRVPSRGTFRSLRPDPRGVTRPPDRRLGSGS